METRIKAKTEIIFRRGESIPIFTFCPKCGKFLEGMWQNTPVYDESNRVEYCPSCDTAYIWSK